MVAKSQGDKSASQSSMELYYPLISGPLRVSRNQSEVFLTEVVLNPPSVMDVHALRSWTSALKCFSFLFQKPA